MNETSVAAQNYDPNPISFPNIMATRSRTLLFLSYRDSAARPRSRYNAYDDNNNDDEQAGLIPTTSTTTNLPPKWYVASGLRVSNNHNFIQG